MKHGRVRALVLVSLAMFLGAAPAAAVPIIDVDFTADLQAPNFTPANGFASIDDGRIQFSDTLGANLVVLDAGLAGGTPLDGALGAFFDDASALRMDLVDILGKSIELTLLNADPAFFTPGDLAVLTAYLTGGVVGTSTVEIGTTDIISFDATLFDSVELLYDVSSGAGLAEVVDRVVVTVIPEPRASVAFGAGALTLGVVFGRRPRRGKARRRRL